MANLSCIVIIFSSLIITQYCIKKCNEFTIPVLQTSKENDILNFLLLPESGGMA